MGPLVTKQLSNYSFAAGTAVTRPVDRLWPLRAQTTSLRSTKLQNAGAATLNFAPKIQKWGSIIIIIRFYTKYNEKMKKIIKK